MKPAVRVMAAMLTVVVGMESFAGSVVVDSAAELAEAVAEAQPGDEVVIAAGTHEGWEATLAGAGTDKAPVVIRPAEPGETLFTGETHLKVTGRHLVIRDLQFRDCTMQEDNTVTLENATHCRITACRFENTSGRRMVFAFRGHANDNRIDHCSLITTVGRPLVIYVSNDHLPQRNRIDHNLFEDVPPKGGNGRETIQIGQNQPAYGALEPRTVVEFNVFRRCNGEGEIISNKSSRNIYRNNVFEDCRGALVMRGGSHCLIEGNRFIRCNGGIRLHGTHHVVVDNTIIEPKGAGIVLPYGMQRPLGSLYQATGHCLVAHNTIVDAGDKGIFLGANRDRDLGYSSSGKKRTWNYEKHGSITVLAEAPYENQIVNNIVTGNQGTLIAVDGSADNAIEANLLHAAGACAAGTAGEQALRGNPEFSNPDMGDYRPGPESPARQLDLVRLDAVNQPDHAGSRGIAPAAGPSADAPQ